MEFDLTIRLKCLFKQKESITISRIVRVLDDIEFTDDKEIKMPIFE